MSRLSADRIVAAHAVIEPAFKNTPQFFPESLSKKLGLELVVKVEALNPIRSFKARGAQWLVAQLQQQKDGARHLVCTSTGNFGQGISYAARAAGMRASVFVPEDCNPLKVEKMKGFGGEVFLIPGDFSQVRAAAEKFAAEQGAKVVIDGREAAIAEGAGTIGLELLNYPKPIDTLVIPLGDGALINGIAAIVKSRAPRTKIVGVCAAGAPAFEASFASKRIASAPADTIADGLAIENPEQESLDDALVLVDEIVTVSDDELIDAMRLVHAELGLVLEPSGASGIAALKKHGAKFRGGLVGTVLTGGNIAEKHRAMLAQ
ncbi:MAG TPA: pyridoxal-phosphate dependent enzyme [Rhizobiaceae bacterium]|nr:pyridoxal-phosphate dependent enzyme [Rhizobiaceae bacterium]